MIRNRTTRYVILTITYIHTIQNGKPKTTSRASITMIKNAKEITLSENSFHQFWSVVELTLTKQSVNLCRADSPLSFDIFVYPLCIVCNSFCVGFGTSKIWIPFPFGVKESRPSFERIRVEFAENKMELAIGITEQHVVRWSQQFTSRFVFWPIRIFFQEIHWHFRIIPPPYSSIKYIKNFFFNFFCLINEGGIDFQTTQRTLIDFVKMKPVYNGFINKFCIAILLIVP